MIETNIQRFNGIDKQLLSQLKLIAPEWASMLADPENNETDIMNKIFTYSYCIVGEAWRFTNNYLKNCGTCIRYSKIFMEDMERQFSSKQTLEEHIQKFIDHVLNNHKRIIE